MVAYALQNDRLQRLNETHFNIDECLKFSDDHINVKGLEPGQQVDQFRIVRELGKGGMSVVYLARDTVLGRKVALKIIRADFADSSKRLKLFLHEAQLTAKFSLNAQEASHNEFAEIAYRDA